MQLNVWNQKKYLKYKVLLDNKYERAEFSWRSNDMDSTKESKRRKTISNKKCLFFSLSGIDIWYHNKILSKCSSEQAVYFLREKGYSVKQTARVVG